MPEISIDIPIKNIAAMISRMNRQDIETLYMYLTSEGAELQDRNKDLEMGRVEYISESEAFDV
jgi:hypothetical protein